VILSPFIPTEGRDRAGVLTVSVYGTADSSASHRLPELKGIWSVTSRAISMMKAIVCTKAGGVEVLEYTDVEAPQLKPGHVLVNVKATALNGADQLQMQGKYPPPEGVHHIL
jgi:hypothetical protein